MDKLSTYKNKFKDKLGEVKRTLDEKLNENGEPDLVPKQKPVIKS